MYGRYRRTSAVIAIALTSGLAMACPSPLWAEESEEHGEHKEEKKPSRISKGPHGEVVVTLDAASQKRIGLNSRVLKTESRQPQTTAYGVLLADPSASFALRAPVPGILAAHEKQPWPRIGDSIQGRLTLGAICPKFTPAERIDLSVKLVAAKGDVQEISAGIAAAKTSFNTKRGLSTGNRVVSELAVQEAEAKLLGMEAKLKAAQESVRLLDAAIQSIASPEGRLPLTVEATGQVTDVLAQPGEYVEANQCVVQIARFDRLLAQVELPAGEHLAAPPKTAMIEPLGGQGGALKGDYVAPAPTVGQMTRGECYLYALPIDKHLLRPGAPVTAFLDLPGAPLKGVILPRSAVVRFGGQTWVYVQTSAVAFTRRQVILKHATPEGWLIDSGLKADDRIVDQAPQMILSEELRTQAGEEGE